MLMAFSQHLNAPILASDAKRSDMRFFCRFCTYEVILRKGDRKIHHFAHKSHSVCLGNRGESEQHYNCKLSIFRSLQSLGVQCEVEKKVGGTIADVYFLDANGNKCAIEVQRSNISTRDLERRTLEYYSNNVYVLWVVPERGRKQNYEYWLEELYYGRVYYWQEQLTLRASWAPDNSVNIVTDFQPVTRIADSIPQCNILLDKYSIQEINEIAKRKALEEAEEALRAEARARALAEASSMRNEILKSTARYVTPLPEQIMAFQEIRAYKSTVTVRWQIKPTDRSYILHLTSTELYMLHCIPNLPVKVPRATIETKDARYKIPLSSKMHKQLFKFLLEASVMPDELIDLEAALISVLCRLNNYQMPEYDIMDITNELERITEGVEDIQLPY
jgi:hypothetical protein